MDKIIKKLQGFSGSEIFLIENNNKKFIRKINNIERNYNQLMVLQQAKFNVPKIYKKEKNILDMEYIDGLDIKTYILNYGIDGLYDFIITTIEKFKTKEKQKDYTKIYDKKLSWLDDNIDLPFTKNELIKKLPTHLPSSVYHGDMTLQNLIYSKTNKFYMIDAITTEYDSWIFDLCKMRQDLTCHWFIRNEKNNNLTTYLNILENKLLSQYPILNNNSLLILVLLRVFVYADKSSEEYFFLLNEIKKLWK